LENYDVDLIVEAAKKGADRAYVPYSSFPVGAAVITKAGTVFTGCNIENASYGATICAERVAIYNAVSTGDADIAAIAVYNAETLSYPCGICLQVMAEFNKDMKVIVFTDDDMVSFELSQLLPFAFTGQFDK